MQPTQSRLVTALGTAVWLAGVALISWTAWTCKEDITGGGPIEVVFPDSNVSYGQQVQPLFNRGCAFSGCHGVDRYDEDGYSLDSYEHLMFGTRTATTV